MTADELAALGSIYSIEFCAMLLWCCATGNDPSLDEVDIIRSNTKLIPPYLLPPLTLVDIKKCACNVTKEVWEKWNLPDMVHYLRDNWRSDDLCKILFPPRTKKDLAIRRSRMPDILFAYLSSHMWHEAETILRSCLNSLDYITTFNLLTYHYVMAGDSPVMYLIRWGAVQAGLENFIKVCKSINNLVKSRDSGSLEPVWGELTGLCGYRNTPFAAFSVKEEAEKLCRGNRYDRINRKGFNWRDGLGVLKALREVKFMTFEDYVQSGLWITAGSVTTADPNVEDHFTVMWGDEKVRIKASKGLLPHLNRLKDIEISARTSEGQLNVCITKCELAKIRLAVANDIQTYLRQSWVVYLTGGAYLAWQGVTLEESVDQTIERELAMLNLLRTGSYVMPFDYAGFDHQPSLDEVVDIWDVLVDMASTNVPPPHFSDFQDIVGKVRGGFYKAVLEGTEEQSQEKFSIKVTWSLMSGLRITSIAGNGWNMVCSKGWVKPTVERWTGRKIQDLRVQGDDTSLIAGQWYVLMMCKAVYDLLGAESQEDKYKIGREGNYLRKMFWAHEGGRTAGYTARALPGVTQRKPWTDTVWSPFGELQSQWEAIDTLKRRGADPVRSDRLWRVLQIRWSSSSNISLRWLQVPTAWGGAGLGDWNGYIPSKALPNATELLPPGLVSVDGTNIVKSRYSNFRLPIADAEAAKIANSDMALALSQSRTASVSRRMREEFRKKVASMSTTWRKDMVAPDNLTLNLPPSIGAYRLFMESAPEGFGSYPEVGAVWEAAAVLARIRGCTTSSIVQSARPDIMQRIKSTEGSRGNRADAIDYLCGKVRLATMNMQGWGRDLAGVFVARLAGRPSNPAYSLTSARLWPAAVAAVSRTALCRTLCRC